MPGLEQVLRNRSRITILRKLCESSDKDFSISELADVTGVDKSLVSRTVHDLAKEKIVKIGERGNLKLCRIDKNGGTYKMLSDIFSSEKKFNGRGRFLWSDWSE